ncbi:MAG: hypothetical protein ABL932_01340, partial [Terricaulis sp.]
MSRAGNTELIEVALVRLKGRSGATRIFTAFPADVAVNEAHASFIEAFHAGRFAEASQLLSALETHARPELSKLYQHYRDRLTIVQAAPPVNWDGVYDPDTK